MAAGPPSQHHLSDSTLMSPLPLRLSGWYFALRLVGPEWIPAIMDEPNAVARAMKFSSDWLTPCQLLHP